MMKQNLSLLVALTAAALVVNFQNAAAQNTAPYWSLAGNSNASAASKLGTTNSTPLRLMTNNLERLRIDSAGRVVIGTTTARGKLTVFNNGSVPGAGWVLSGTPVFTSFGETTGGNADHILGMASNTVTARPNIIGRRARGTLASPLAVIENDFITSFQASAYDGSAFQNPANIDFFVDGTPSAGNVPVRISLTTGSNLSNRVERLKVGSTGNFTFNGNQLYLDNATGRIGIGTITPAYKLHVKGGLYAVDSNLYESTTGVTAGGSAYGIYATATGVSDFNDEVVLGGVGVYGKAINGESIGVVGEGSYIGVKGIGSSVGVEANGTFGLVAYSTAQNGSGVYTVVFGESATAVSANSDKYHGIIAGTNNPDAYAGFFSGNVYSSGSYVGSDRKLKQNITQLNSAMSILNKLQPKTYEYRQDGDFKLMNLPAGKRYGLIAQEVEEVLPQVVKATVFETRFAKPQKQDSIKNFLKAAATSSEKIDFKAVNYTELIPIMIKGMQEQDAEIEELEKKAAEVDALKERLTKLEALLAKGGTGGVSVSSAYVDQSNPNPVSGTAIIRYQIPATSVSARLTITNAKGQLVKTINLNNKGAGQVTINASTLATGTYNYTLWVDGNQADTKRLVVIR